MEVLLKALEEVLKLAYQSVGLPIPYFSQDELYLALQEAGVPQNGLALTEGSANDITVGKPPKEGVGEGSKSSGKVDSKGLPTPTEMMKAAEEQGSKSLESATRSALNRLIAKHGVEGILRQRRLFDDVEREAVTNALNETLTTSDLLGRARIRTHDTKHSTLSEGLRSFAEPIKHPLPPTKALQYFAKKIPQLKRLLANGEYAETNHDKAFELALNTDEVVLGKIKDAIRKALEEKRVFSGQDAVNRILEESGVGTTVKGNPVDAGYSQMLFRTNMSEAMNKGAYSELQEVADAFPVWQYANPVDYRSRPSHAAKNGKYYPTSKSFEEVRGKGEESVCNCRCTFIPIPRGTWAKLQKQGKTLERD